MLSFWVWLVQAPKPNQCRQDGLFLPSMASCGAVPGSPPCRTMKCWPGHPSTPPHILFFSSDGSPPRTRTSQPSYSPPPTTTLSHLPRFLFIPIRGLAVVLRLGVLAAVPPSGLVNMVNMVNRGRTVLESMTVGTHQVHCRTQASASLLLRSTPQFFTHIHLADIWDRHHCQRIVN
jgi:hypothetical protein